MLKTAIIALFVTVAVTLSGCHGQKLQAAPHPSEQVTPPPDFGVYAIVVDLPKYKKTFAFKDKLYPSRVDCAAAIKGLDRFLADVAKIDASNPQTYEAPEADPLVRKSLAHLVVALMERHNELPVLTISCEDTTPARGT